MATIIRRGDSYRVQWPAPLPGKPGHKDDETLYTEPDAILFKNLVEMPAWRGQGKPLAQGKQRRPSVEVLRDHPWDTDRYAWLTGIESEIEEVIKPPSVITVEQAMRLWIEWRLDPWRLKLKPIEKKTQDGYWSVFHNYIQGSVIAGEPVATVNHRMIDEFTSEQLDRKKRSGSVGAMSPNSVRKALTQLSQMFKWACSTRSDPDLHGETPLRMKASPMEEAERPKAKKDPRKDMLVLRNAREYEIFFQCAYWVDPWWADFLVITALTGMRFGEISALMTQQVYESPEDWPDDAPGNGHKILIDQRYSTVKTIDPKTGKTHWNRILVPGTKSGRDIFRDVRLPDGAWPIIGPHLANKQFTDHVFEGPYLRGHGSWHESAERARWHPKAEAKTENGYRNKYLSIEIAKASPNLGRRLRGDMRHHRLRHSIITYLKTAADGFPAIPADHVELMVGHTVPGVSGTYTHMGPEQWMPILDRLERLVAPVAEIRELAYKQYFADHGAPIVD